jgi:hypothetical protein
MKIKKLDRNAVRSTEKSERRLAELTKDELSTIVAGVEACNCAYKYGSTGIGFEDSEATVL